VKITIKQQGLQDGPADAHGTLLVADADVSPYQDLEQVPVRPQLAQFLAQAALTTADLGDVSLTEELFAQGFVAGLAHSETSPTDALAACEGR
jgi:hypothetical protein